MAKRAIGFLILSMLTTSWLVVPVVTQAEAATTNKHIKKKMRVVHQRPSAADPSASPYSSIKYEDDFDRKNAGGGGGY
ncbi:hypothetical protein [Bradyrhizobium erythrophlei]|jgi:hypothetical protein|uniref:Uncharacterized protein n=1 Tax=Bradyrhizobium erythrophlei TaxID=1437360 RepID=A0A1M7SSF4_9BRAD|nr:hypothetical protein [Bradyrhizobium erythrophlei]SHN61473.1 hypothetical protein SAMN05444170_0130 [Bradyrhizobium erythrophlei]